MLQCSIAKMDSVRCLDFGSFDESGRTPSAHRIIFNTKQQRQLNINLETYLRETQHRRSILRRDRQPDHNLLIGFPPLKQVSEKSRQKLLVFFNFQKHPNHFTIDDLFLSNSLNRQPEYKFDVRETMYLDFMLRPDMLQRVTRWLTGVLSALEYLWAQNLGHWDVREQNVMISRIDDTTLLIGLHPLSLEPNIRLKVRGPLIEVQRPGGTDGRSYDKQCLGLMVLKMCLTGTKLWSRIKDKKFTCEAPLATDPFIRMALRPEVFIEYFKFVFGSDKYCNVKLGYQFLDFIYSMLCLKEFPTLKEWDSQRESFLRGTPSFPEFEVENPVNKKAEFSIDPVDLNLLADIIDIGKQNSVKHFNDDEHKETHKEGEQKSLANTIEKNKQKECKDSNEKMCSDNEECSDSEKEECSHSKEELSHSKEEELSHSKEEECLNSKEEELSHSKEELLRSTAEL